MDEASKHPITYRLPSKGTDPYFGLTRSFYYAAETQGRLTLIRLRSKGKSRGVTNVGPPRPSKTAPRTAQPTADVRVPKHTHGWPAQPAPQPCARKSPTLASTASLRAQPARAPQADPSLASSKGAKS